MVNPIKRPTPTLVRNVQRSQPNLHYGEMKEACRLKPKQLAAKLGLTEITTSDGKKMWFKDNGSKVLFVAHLDSVQSYFELDTVKFREDTWITCPTLDDRIGVYVGAYWLPKAGIKPDLLFTTDEEKMKSTGHYFAPPKEYNWMFMFDRRGDGAVAYQYENEQLRYKLGKHSITLLRGSYSCIKEMSHLNCIGINFGAGYDLNHSTFAYCSKKVLEKQLRKFRDFWDEYSTTKMPYEKSKASDYGYTRFADKVNHHAREWRKENILNVKGSEDYGDYKKKQEALALKHYGEFGPADSREVGTAGIIDTPFELIETAIPSLPAAKRLTYQDVKTCVLVDKEGRLTSYISTRNVWKLYWDIETLPIDKVIQNILRAQWKIHTLYDLSKVSAYTLVNSGYITAKDADIIRMAMVDAGFDMPMNVQSFMTPEQYQRQLAVGYRARASAVTGHVKPVPVEKRMMDVAKRLNNAKERLDALSGRMKVMDEKRMDLFPLPDVDTSKVIETSRELIKDGYDMRAYSQCTECLKQFQWDMTKLDATPSSCPKCQDDAKQLSLFPAIKKDEGSDILTKIQLVRDKNDKTRFRYTGKVCDKLGIERFAWIEQREFEKLKVGF